MHEPLSLMAAAPVAVLGTVGRDGRPHLVPVTFAFESGTLVTAVDWKPKSGKALQRLANIERDPRATLLTHHYSDDWSELWWVRVDGRAAIHHEGPTWDRAIAALVDKYGQYRERPPDGSVIAITPEKTVAWAADS